MGRGAKRSDKVKHAGERCCQCCGEPVRAGWHLPSSCKGCGASFDQRPRWSTTLVFFASVLVAIAVVALVSLAIDVTAVLVIIGLCVGLVAFNLLEVVLFRAGAIKLTNVNVPNDTEGIRLATYAGTDKRTRAAQAEQLRGAIELAKSIRGANGTDAADAMGAANNRPKPAASSPRCRFRKLDESDERGIRVMSTLATRIVREHFDPIIGVEQNDYMLARFQTPEAIAAQLAEGYEYFFVLPPKEAAVRGGAGQDGAAQGDAARNGAGQGGDARNGGKEKPRRVRPIGFLAVQARDRELYLSKFYLVKEERGQGYARSMMALVARRGRELGCDCVRLNVNRNNYQAILAYEHLGFTRTGEQQTDIGSGFVMDDYVYERPL